MKRIAAFLLILGISCSACFAGSGPDQKHIDKIRKQVSKLMDRGAMVTVETYDQHKLWGAINEAGPDTFVLTVADKPATLHYSDVRKIKAPMDVATKRRIVMAAVLGGLLGLTTVVLSHD